MNNHTTSPSTGKAALIAGVGLLLMVIAAPFSEMYAYPKLVVPGDAAQTVKNIIANETLYNFCIVGYLITFICDVIVAWALFIFFKSVNGNVSLLTAWFRVVYTAIALSALLNLITVHRIAISNQDVFLKLLGPDQLNAQVLLSLKAFKSGFHFGIVFFGIHLLLIGYLIVKSDYVPTLIGVLVILSGLGYLTTGIEPYLFRSINLDFAKFTFYGELVFMLWLLIKGSRIKNREIDTN